MCKYTKCTVVEGFLTQNKFNTFLFMWKILLLMFLGYFLICPKLCLPNFLHNNLSCHFIHLKRK